jgi:hypothetical protein
LFTADQFGRKTRTTEDKDNPFLAQNPSRGVIEAKPPSADINQVVGSEQVERYWKKYGMMLVTNFRSFALIGKNPAGQPSVLESFSLADSEKEFWQLADHPRKTADERGARMLKYLRRVLLHNAPLAEPKDVATILASYAQSCEAEDLKWRLPILEMIPPNIGDEVDGFGYHSSYTTPLNGSIDWHTSPASSSGVVRAVHLEKRDCARLQFPCFQTTARFDGGMSGGGVFNKAGRLCGIICSSLPPTADEPEIEYASYVSLLWPALGVPVDELYDNPPVAAPYTLFDLAKHAGCNIHGLDHVGVERPQSGQILSVKYAGESNHA